MTAYWDELRKHWTRGVRIDLFLQKRTKAAWLKLNKRASLFLRKFILWNVSGNDRFRSIERDAHAAVTGELVGNALSCAGNAFRMRHSCVPMCDKQFSA